MRRIIIFIAMILLIIPILSGCNKQIIDTTYRFDKVIISLPDGKIIKGKLQSWKDYDDSDQIQVRVDGTTYLIHSANVVLIAE